MRNYEVHPSYAIKWLLSILLFLPLGLSQAAGLDITSEFIADISQPGKNEFTNTTPLSGYCGGHPEYCGDGEFTISIPAVNAQKQLDSLSSTLENTVSISADGVPRDVTLTDPVTGNSMVVSFRLSFIGMTIHRLDAASGDLMGAIAYISQRPSGGCSGTSGAGNDSVFIMGWGIPNAKVSCYGKYEDSYGSTFHGRISIENFSIGYNLVSPDPLNVYAGTYEGELVYSMGDNGDIDFHAQDTSEDELRIRLKATVKHAFDIKFAPGSENVELGAQGGWEPWINGGRVPQSLSKEVPFSLSSSTAFTVSMRCGHDAGNQKCGLQNTQSNETVPLDVALTLPGFKSQGADVKNMLLTSAAQGYEIDAPGTFITDRRSHVDFRVLHPAVETMVKSPNSTWAGTVTLLFDSLTE